jgi:hypothetical protein
MLLSRTLGMHGLRTTPQLFVFLHFLFFIIFLVQICVLAFSLHSSSCSASCSAALRCICERHMEDHKAVDQEAFFFFFYFF